MTFRAPGQNPTHKSRRDEPTPPISIFPSDQEEAKACTKCGEEKPLDAFARDRSKKHGRKAVCKACDTERGKAYYAAHRDGVLQRVKKSQAAKRQPKPCTVCGAETISRRHSYCATHAAERDERRRQERAKRDSARYRRRKAGL